MTHQRERKVKHLRTLTPTLFPPKQHTKTLGKDGTDQDQNQLNRSHCKNPGHVGTGDTRVRCARRGRSSGLVPTRRCARAVGVAHHLDDHLLAPLAVSRDAADEVEQARPVELHQRRTIVREEYRVRRPALLVVLLPHHHH